MPGWNGCAGFALVVVDRASLGLHGLRPRLWPCSSLEADGPSVHTTHAGTSERSWYRKMVHRRQGRFQQQSRQGSAVRRAAQSYGAARSSGGGAGPAETGGMVHIQTGDVKWIDAGYARQKKGLRHAKGRGDGEGQEGRNSPLWCVNKPCRSMYPNFVARQIWLRSCVSSHRFRANCTQRGAPQQCLLVRMYPI